MHVSARLTAALSSLHYLSVFLPLAIPLHYCFLFVQAHHCRSLDFSSPLLHVDADFLLAPVFRATGLLFSRKPFLNRRLSVFMYRIRPVPLVRRRRAFSLQLSEQHQREQSTQMMRYGQSMYTDGAEVGEYLLVRPTRSGSESDGTSTKVVVRVLIVLCCLSACPSVLSDIFAS